MHEKSKLLIYFVLRLHCCEMIWLSYPSAGHTEAVLAVSFSPDGRCLASGSGDTTVRFWDLNTQTPLFTCKGGFLNSCILVLVICSHVSHVLNNCNIYNALMLVFMLMAWLFFLMITKCLPTFVIYHERYQANSQQTCKLFLALINLHSQCLML